MKTQKILLSVMLALAPLLAVAQDEGMALQKADVNLNDTASLQRGAKYFVNYCMGCHSAQYVRYNRVEEDLGLNDAQVENYLIPAGGRATDTMVSAMPAADSEKWFGRTPPDLSLEARSRGADWIYTYLKSFYVDDKSPTGANNLALPNAAMPNVLWELQGLQQPVFKTVKRADGVSEQVLDHFEQVMPGKLSPEDYDRAAMDLTNFLVYISEPVQLERRDLGLRVIGFLIVFFLFAFLLKREIWKKVH
jgi:ubiquinol-cytochrome c reductase cytochrome c1 subunit